MLRAILSSSAQVAREHRMDRSMVIGSSLQVQWAAMGATVELEAGGEGGSWGKCNG